MAGPSNAPPGFVSPWQPQYPTQFGPYSPLGPAPTNPTSGTVQTYSYDQRKVIDHAMRRAGRFQPSIGAEDIAIAQDLIYTTLSEWINAGFPLWTKEFVLLPCQIGSPDIVTPQGTVEVLTAFWRVLNPYRGPAATNTGTNVSQLFGGAPTTDVIIPGPNAGVIVNFGTQTEVDTIGILPGAAGLNQSNPAILSLEVSTSNDGVTWTSQQALTAVFYSGIWAYFDLDPTLTFTYLQVSLPTGTLDLQQMNFGLANGQDIMFGVLNIDDYYTLPNKQYQASRPNSFWQDRQLTVPVLKMWPTANQDAYYNGTPSALIRRYIQDPGQMTNGIEVPARALEALQWRVAQKLVHELPDEPNSQQNYFTLMAKQQRIQNIEQNAMKAEALFWSEERTRGPIRLAPSIRGYTK